MSLFSLFSHYVRGKKKKNPCAYVCLCVWVHCVCVCAFVCGVKTLQSRCLGKVLLVWHRTRACIMWNFSVVVDTNLCHVTQHLQPAWVPQINTYEFWINSRLLMNSKSFLRGPNFQDPFYQIQGVSRPTIWEACIILVLWNLTPCPGKG